MDAPNIFYKYNFIVLDGQRTQMQMSEHMNQVKAIISQKMSTFTQFGHLILVD